MFEEVKTAIVSILEKSDRPLLGREIKVRGYDYLEDCTMCLILNQMEYDGIIKSEAESGTLNRAYELVETE